MIISVLHDLETKYIDFTLGFPQADLDVDVDVFMELHVGFDLGPDSRKYAIKSN